MKTCRDGMQRIFRATVCLSLLFLISCSAREAAVVHGQFIDSARLTRLVEIQRIAVLKPQVTLVDHHLSSDPKQSAELERHITQWLQQLVTSVDNRDLQLRTHVAINNNERYESYRLTATADRLLSPVVNRERLPSLGPVVNRLAATDPMGLMEQPEALLAVRYRGYRKSSGQRRKERLASALASLITLGKRSPDAPPVTDGQLLLALVDSYSGDVLWSGTGNAAPAQLPELVERMMTNLLLQHQAR